MATLKTGYTTSGAIRGECGHVHRTLRAALACKHRDELGCRSQGGYSDRYVYRIVVGRLTEDDCPQYAEDMADYAEM